MINRLAGVIMLSLITGLLFWSAVPGQAAFEIPGLIHADGYEILDASSSHVIFRGGSPEVVWIDQTSDDRITVRSSEITVIWRRADPQRSQSTEVDRVTLKGPKSTAVSAQRGFSIEASEIEVVVPKVRGQGAIESAFAGGIVRLVQSQGEITGDASADTLEIKDGGDTAILTGNASMNYANPQYKGKITGDVIRITEILPREGKPSDPLIRAEKRPAAGD